jgi:streptogramin lyase
MNASKMMGVLAAVLLAGASQAWGQLFYMAPDRGGTNGTVYSVSSGGVVTPFVAGVGGGTSETMGLAVDSSGSLYAACLQGNSVYKVTPSGAISTFATGFTGTACLAFDKSGNLYVSDDVAGTIDKITPSGAVSTFATVASPTGLAFNASGDLFVTSNAIATISEITPSGAVSVFATIPGRGSWGLAFDAAGNLYVPDTSSSSAGIYKITPGGSISTFASGFCEPQFVTFDQSGNLYTDNYPNYVSEITPSGQISTFETGPNGPMVLAGVTPEPATLSLLVLGGLTMLRRRR